MYPTGKRVTVGTSPTLLVRNSSAVVLRNLGSVEVNLGSPSVAAGEAFPLQPGEFLRYDFRDGKTGEVYGVVASGTAVVAVLSEPIQ